MTQKEKILTLMCREPKRWFFVYDFMRPDLGELFVGYKASARVPELAAEYPDMFEAQGDGKYLKRRIRFDFMNEWVNTLDKPYRELVIREYTGFQNV